MPPVTVMVMAPLLPPSQESGVGVPVMTMAPLTVTEATPEYINPGGYMMDKKNLPVMYPTEPSKITGFF